MGQISDGVINKGTGGVRVILPTLFVSPVFPIVTLAAIAPGGGASLHCYRSSTRSSCCSTCGTVTIFNILVCGTNCERDVIRCKFCTNSISSELCLKK